MTEIRGGVEDTTERFTLFKTFPINSAIPAVNKDQEGNEIASVMVVVDDDMIDYFKNGRDNILDVQVTTYLRNGHNDGKKDLVIRIDFFLHKAHAIYEAVVDGDLDGQQREFVRVLKNSDMINIWITDIFQKIDRIIPVNWSFDSAKIAIKELI